MKRKLAVAVALVGGPSVVLLDEPSSGLDPGAQRNLWDLIKVTMKGRAVVLTTHSMGEADLLCDRVGIMVKGELRSDSVKSARFALEIRALYFG